MEEICSSVGRTSKGRRVGEGNVVRVVCGASVEYLKWMSLEAVAVGVWGGGGATTPEATGRLACQNGSPADAE